MTTLFKRALRDREVGGERELHRAGASRRGLGRAGVLRYPRAVLHDTALNRPIGAELKFSS